MKKLITPTVARAIEIGRAEAESALLPTYNWTPTETTLGEVNVTDLVCAIEESAFRQAGSSFHDHTSPERQLVRNAIWAGLGGDQS